MQLDRSYQLNKKILNLFTTGSAELGINLSDIQIQKFSKFVFYLRKWNKIHNLTAIFDSQEIVTNHLLDSLSVNKYLSGEKIIDVGTGPGFPGLPLALIFPKKAFVLLDSSQKKNNIFESNKGTYVYRKCQDYQSSGRKLSNSR